MPKTHKENNPLRLVTSCINSPVSQLSDFYKDILNVACKKPEHLIKNTIDFKEKVKDIVISKHHVMASLDIVSLFPSIPYELVKESITKRWVDFKEFSNLPFEEFMKGLEVLKHSLFFQNDNKYYKQINGLPIGLSVSPIIADIVLLDLKEIFLRRYSKSIKFYGRYVDDSFIIIAKNKLNMLLKFLNTTHNRLKFTHEVEINNQINFF